MMTTISCNVPLLELEIIVLQNQKKGVASLYFTANPNGEAETGEQFTFKESSRLNLFKI